MELGGDRVGLCRVFVVVGGGEKVVSELSNLVFGLGGEEGV